MSRAPVLISEAHIQETCSDYLVKVEGWRRIKTDLKRLRGLGVQEVGMADDFFIRYLSSYMLTATATDRALAEVLIIEWKRRTGKVAAHQHDWHAAERARGALTWIAGIDFMASIEGFIAHYEASGLARNLRRQNAGGGRG